MSNRKCCVSGCPNREGSVDVLHKFPNPSKYKELFNTWVNSVGADLLGLEHDHIFKYRRVCHRHFEEKYWCRNNRLSNIAVPTKNMPECVTVTPHLDSGAPQHHSQSIVDVPMKENSECVTVTLHLDFGAPQHHSQSIVGDVPMKENIECVTVTPLDSVAPQQCGKMERTKLVKKKKVRKHVAVTPAEQAIYRKLLQVGVKLSECRQKQAVKMKAMQKIMTNPDFLKTLDNLPSRAKVLTMMQFKEHTKKNKERLTLQEKIVALSIFKHRRKYKLSRKVFILPSPTRATVNCSRHRARK